MKDLTDDDLRVIRALAFGAALVAIASRQCTVEPKQGYSPDNCAWCPSQKIQTANMGRNVFVLVEGKRMCFKQAAELLGLNAGNVRSRYARGWSIERAFEGRAKAVHM